MASSTQFNQLLAQSNAIVLHNREELFETVSIMKYNRDKLKIYIRFLQTYLSHLSDDDNEKVKMTETLYRENAQMARLNIEINMFSKELAAMSAK